MTEEKEQAECTFKLSKEQAYLLYTFLYGATLKILDRLKKQEKNLNETGQKH
jgi:hypothetical protein